VRGLRNAIGTEVQAMLLGAYRRIAEGSRRLPMSEVAPLHRRAVVVEPQGSYPELGIRSFGKGTFHKPSLSGLDVGTKKLFRIEAGDLLFNIMFAWEGAVAVARPEDQGRVGSHRFLTCVPKPGLATSSFLHFHFLTDEGLEQLGRASPGGAGRNRTLGQKALQQIEVPVPAFERQLWFTSLLEKVEALKRLVHDADEELDALLPSILDKAFKGDL
jgi:type I restriction enzyme S subunit